MIVSFILGLLKLQWWWPVLLGIGGTLFDWFMLKPASDNWRREAGIETIDGASVIFLSLVLAIVMNLAVYGVGRGLRYGYGRMRNAQEG